MANKIIQMKDGSDNLYPKSAPVSDISSEFTYKLNDGTGTMLAYYDATSGRVWGTFSVFNASAFAMTTAIYQVSSAYRPSATVNFPVMVVNASGWSAYRGTIGTNGNIAQGLTSTAVGAYGSFEYYI